jgi:hypothetical protein
VVAREELPEAEGVAGGAGADDAEALEAARHERLAPGDERAEDHLAERRLGRDDAADLGGGDVEHVGLAPRDGAHDGAPPAQDVDVARELARAVEGHPPRRAARVVEDLHGAREHDEEAAAAVTRLEQRLAVAEVARRRERLQHRELGVVQPGGVDAPGDGRVERPLRQFDGGHPSSPTRATVHPEAGRLHRTAPPGPAATSEAAWTAAPPSTGG